MLIRCMQYSLCQKAPRPAMTVLKIKIQQHFYKRRGKAIPQSSAAEAKLDPVDHFRCVAVRLKNMLMPPESKRPAHLHIDKMRVFDKSFEARMPAQTWRIFSEKNNFRSGAQRQIDALEIHPRKKRADFVDRIDVSIQRPHFFQRCGKERRINKNGSRRSRTCARRFF